MSTATVVEYVSLCLAAAIAGAVNALAGGGTLLTFPALMQVLSRDYGKTAGGVLANGTSTVALVPASLGSAWAFRREMYHLRRLLVWLIPPSLIGGAIGAILLVQFPEQFNALIPWLILGAALLFLLQPYLVKRFSGRAVDHDASDADTAIPPLALGGMVVLQFVIAIYGGYFGAGIGILMLSGLGLMGLSNMHQMNGLKAVLGTAINGVAVLVFLIKENVVWPYALAMMVTSTFGGYLAAHYSRQVPGKFVRWFVIGIGFCLAIYFFWKQYG